MDKVDELHLLIVDDAFPSSTRVAPKENWQPRFIKGPFRDPLGFKTMRYC